VLGGVTRISRFLKNVFSGSKYCPTLLETVGLRVPNLNSREFGLFNVDFKRPNCPSARWALATNDIGSDNDIFNGRSVSVKPLKAELNPICYLLALL